MSENVFFLVPRAPEWQPSLQAATRAAALLKTMATSPDQVDFKYYEQLQLFHPFGNWEGVRCPYCSVDVEDWFHGMLDTVYIDEIWTRLDAMTPCCHRPVSLNDLAFGWPCAFGRFAVRGVNAGAVPDADQMTALEACLGCKLTGVWRRL